jgi:hypothetical protein
LIYTMVLLFSLYIFPFSKFSVPSPDAQPGQVWLNK